MRPLPAFRVGLLNAAIRPLTVRGAPPCSMHRTYLVLAVALCLSAGVVIALEAPRDQVSVRDSHPARASIGALPLACHAMECQDELAEQRLSTKPARSEHRGASRGDFTARQILPLSQYVFLPFKLPISLALAPSCGRSKSDSSFLSLFTQVFGHDERRKRGGNIGRHSCGTRGPSGGDSVVKLDKLDIFG